MLRLSLLLGVAVYSALVISSEKLPAPNAGDAALVTASSDGGDGPISAHDILVTQDGRQLPVATIISPALVPSDTAVAMVSTRPALSVTASASASTGLPDLPLVEVTGRYVNLRAEPSVQAAVLTALGQGEQAELIGADGNGWVLIRAVATGIEGYMSDQFVAVVN